MRELLIFGLFNDTVSNAQTVYIIEWDDKIVTNGE
jgi:hypothetical protein